MIYPIPLILKANRISQPKRYGIEPKPFASLRGGSLNRDATRNELGAILTAGIYSNDTIGE